MAGREREQSGVCQDSSRPNGESYPREMTTSMAPSSFLGRISLCKDAVPHRSPYTSIYDSNVSPSCDTALLTTVLTIVALQ